MDQERLDIVIFGATGFTGRRAVREAERLAKERHFTWGVAGRRKDALELVLKEFAPESENIRVIIADLQDEESLKNMAEQAKVIVNCCGPYRFYGEPVIKACIAAKTSHVDVSGEPQYMEKIQLHYNKAAQEAGIYIVSACGIDSIPCDLGVIFTQKNFEGVVNSVEGYLNVWTTVNVGGSSMNYATWESAVHGLAHAKELGALRSKLFPNKLPEFKPRLEPKGFLHRSSISDGWSMVFPGADRPVCLRTQRFLYDKYNQRPAQVQAYVTFKSFWSVFTTTIVGGALEILSKSEFGRNLLLKHPRFFSGGLISHEDPKSEDIENTYFSITFLAKGWPMKLAGQIDKVPPSKEMITKVSGRNPAYGATNTMVLMSALTILRESDKMPDNGGVLTPGAAFGNTNLIEELNKHGVKFEVLSSIENVEVKENSVFVKLRSKLNLLSKL